uniref:Zinc finger ZPR1-type domain-containing protein n=1 Tax=Mucochytrium quahogii TaxID=96639 RepID=A0A7S2R5W7_9STRA
MESRERGQEESKEELEDEHDHPVIDRTPQPSRVDDALSDMQTEAIAHGQANDLSEISGDILATLKVFEQEDNQLGVEDVVRVTVPCLECTGTGLYQRVEMKIPRFGKAEIQSFSCSSCSYSYNRVRPLATEREEVLPEGMGRRITLNIKRIADFDREVVLADGAFLKVPFIDLEYSGSDGVMSTVEGCLVKVANDLKRIHISCDEVGFMGETSGAVDEQLERIFSHVRNGGEVEFIIEDDEDRSYISSLKTEVDDGGVEMSCYMVEDDSQRVEAPTRNCTFLGIYVGGQCQALYNEEWIENCRIVETNETFVWVEEIGQESNGKWMVSHEAIRGCDDVTCSCQVVDQATPDAEQARLEANPSNMTDEEILAYLNKLADHMQVQDDVSTLEIKREANREAQNKLGEKVLEELD